jgi:Fe2+ transport system protein B
MGLFSFLGCMALLDESSKKFGTVPTFLGAMAIDEILKEEQQNYWESVNDFWQEVQSNDSISDEKKEIIYKLCNQLVETSNEKTRKKLIKQIDLLLK